MIDAVAKRKHTNYKTLSPPGRRLANNFNESIFKFKIFIFKFTIHPKNRKIFIRLDFFVVFFFVTCRSFSDIDSYIISFSSNLLYF